MVPPKLVPHLVQTVVPAPADEQKVFPVEILHSKALLGCQGVIDGHCAPYGLPAELQGGALPGLQKILIEQAGHDVDVLPQVPQDLHRVFRGVLIGDHTEFYVWTVLLDPRPQIQQKPSWRHGDTPMRIALSPSWAAFLARTTESLQYWMMYWASR